ncbi:hypothetical protein H5410_036502 [Solanum commersonii]|uniref:Uncharacterized protein n=1 Tax=Solanum commersonii TaxID=4109 RepID=A0A9J5Y8C2_SOLCO|nr:hypothetical protein H5410_036502 [Solanum commersonii]
MASLKSFDHKSLVSLEVDILSFSDSSDDSLVSLSPSFKWKASSVKKKEDQKKPRHDASGSLSPEDMQNGELETRAMGICIIVNDFLFEDIFGPKFSSVIQYMNGVRHDDFEVSLEGAKIVVAKPGADLSYFGTGDFQDVVEMVFCIEKDTSADVGKLHIAMTGIKHKASPWSTS